VDVVAKTESFCYCQNRTAVVHPMAKINVERQNKRVFRTHEQLHKPRGIQTELGCKKQCSKLLRDCGPYVIIVTDSHIAITIAMV
jgi:hypothetical protein